MENITQKCVMIVMLKIKKKVKKIELNGTIIGKF